MSDSHSTSSLIPPATAVMVLPETALFPHQRLPLYIFEPQYRAMLADALEDNRMFAIGMTADQPTDEDDNFETYGGIGLVRACVRQDDGTSQLVLQGLSRVKFVGPVERRPYRWSAIEPLPTQIVQHEAAKFWHGKLRSNAKRLVEKQPEAFHALGEICRMDLEPELHSDLIAGAIPMAKSLSLRLLSEPITEKRLEWLARIVDAILKNLDT